MGGAFCTYEGEKKCVLYFGDGNLKDRCHSENLDVDARIILTRILKIRCEGVDWMCLAHERFN